MAWVVFITAFLRAESGLNHLFWSGSTLATGMPPRPEQTLPQKQIILVLEERLEIGSKV